MSMSIYDDTQRYITVLNIADDVGNSTKNVKVIDIFVGLPTVGYFM